MTDILESSELVERLSKINGLAYIGVVAYIDGLSGDEITSLSSVIENSFKKAGITLDDVTGVILSNRMMWVEVKDDGNGFDNLIDLVNDLPDGNLFAVLITPEDGLCTENT